VILAARLADSMTAVRKRGEMRLKTPARGSSLTFIDGVGGASNIWIQPLDKGSPRQLTHFTTGTIATFDWSADGSRLAWLRVQELRDVVAVALPAAQR